MSKLVLEANVRLKAEIKDIDKALYDKVVAEYHTEKELENRAKKDFERDGRGEKKTDNRISQKKFTFRDGSRIR